MRWYKCYSSMHKVCREGVHTSSRVSGSTFLLGRSLLLWTLTYLLFAHLFSQPVPIPSGHFLPLKNTALLLDIPLIHLCGHQLLSLLHIFKDPCSSTWSSLLQVSFSLPSNTISGPLIFSQNCPQGLKWVRKSSRRKVSD